MIDPWEAFQSYQRTAVVLDHFDHEINNVLGGVQTEDGEHRRVRVMLLAGSDLISTMSEPGVWSEPDVRVPHFFPYTVASAHVTNIPNLLSHVLHLPPSPITPFFIPSPFSEPHWTCDYHVPVPALRTPTNEPCHL